MAVDFMLRLIVGAVFRRCFVVYGNCYALQDYGFTPTELKRFSKTPMNTWTELVAASATDIQDETLGPGGTKLYESD